MATSMATTAMLSHLAVVLILIALSPTLTKANSTTGNTSLVSAALSINETSATALPPPTSMSLGIGNQTTKPAHDYNGTGYYIEDDAEPAGLNDVQTVLLACFATLVPLMVSLFTAFGIKMLWSKYKRRKGSGQYDGIHREGTSESLTRPLHAHLMNKDTSDTNLVIANEDEDAAEIVCTDQAVMTSSSKNATSGSSAGGSTSNGSIITMTLKNNHLIVETEERSDLDENSRKETTMRYSPSARDGVFIVEVQQGPKRPPAATALSPTPVTTEADALVHHPPDRLTNDEELDDDDEEKIDTSLAESLSSLANSVIAQPIRTGLSQSNTSLSTMDPPSYCYTNQQGYDNGNYGYPVYAGYVNNEPDSKRVIIDQNNTRPKIMAAVYKNPPPIEAGLTMGGACGVSSEVNYFKDNSKDLNSKYNEGNYEGEITKDKGGVIEDEGGANTTAGGANENEGGANETVGGANEIIGGASVSEYKTNPTDNDDFSSQDGAVHTNGN